MRILLQNISTTVLSIDVALGPPGGPIQTVFRENLIPSETIDVGDFATVEMLSRNAQIQSLVTRGFLTIQTILEPSDLFTLSEIPTPPPSSVDNAVHIYVDNVAGSDANRGTFDQPVQTINEAVRRQKRWLERDEDRHSVIEVLNGNGSYAEDVDISLVRIPRRRVHMRGDIASQTISKSGTVTSATANTVTDTAATLIPQPVNVTGVVIIDHGTTNDGTGTLAFTFVGTLLSWQAPTVGSPGPAVNVGAGGTFTLFGGDAQTFIRVTVTGGSLPGSNQSDVVSVVNWFGRIVRIYDNATPATKIATERYQSIRSYTNNSFNSVLAQTFGAPPSTPIATWVYEILMPAARITGSPTGVPAAAPLQVSMPWTSAPLNTILNGPASPGWPRATAAVVLAWLRVSNDDTAAPGALLSQGGLIRNVGCVFDGNHGGAAIRGGGIDHGLDSDATGDAVFGLVGANTWKFFHARSLYKVVTSTTKPALELIDSRLSTGPMCFGSQIAIFAEWSKLDLSQGGALYRGQIQDVSSVVQMLLGSTGNGFLFRGINTVPALAACVAMSREAHVSFRAGSFTEFMDCDLPCVHNFSLNSATFDTATVGLVLTRHRAAVAIIREGTNVRVNANAVGAAGNWTPELLCDGPNAVFTTAIGGVREISFGSAVITGSGTLAYTAAGQTLTWTAPGDAAGAPVAVGAGGSFDIPSLTALMQFRVHVRPELLPAGNVSTAVAVSNHGLATGTFASIGATAGGDRTPVVGTNSGARIHRV
jgi:hypothetical protein